MALLHEFVDAPFRYPGLYYQNTETKIILYFLDMLEAVISQTLRRWPEILTLFISLYLASNHFHNGLNKYPGPFLGSLSNLWRFFDVYGRRPDITHLKLHRKNGDVVRLGPNLLSFADPNAVKTIYGLNKGFIKVCTILQASL